MKTGISLAIILTVLGQQIQAEPTRHQSGIQDQRDVMVTVYNNDYGLIREVRELTLPRGEVELEFRDVAERIDPTSVAFRSLSHPNRLKILEQNYRYDLLNPSTLLTRYIGRELKFINYVTRENSQIREEREGVLVSTNGGTIVRFGDQIEINPAGTIAMSDIPDELLAEPTLIWLLDSGQKRKQLVEASYLTNGMSWQADYVVVVNEDDSELDLTGWVTLNNRSGASYRQATLKLIAGDVRRVEEPVGVAAMELGSKQRFAAAQPFKERSFFEYHLYALDRKTTLANNETKQISLLQGHGIRVAKKLSTESSPHVYSAAPDKRRVQVDVALEFENSERNNLGMALPGGRVRVYKSDEDESLQLIGEERVDHSPRDEDVNLNIGKAFDLVVDRRQTSYSKRGKRSSEVAFEIDLRNHKDDKVEITVIEHLPGDWTITAESHDHQKTDARTIEYLVDVPARGATKVTYTARVDW